jgi:hypothetical protein
MRRSRNHSIDNVSNSAEPSKHDGDGGGESELPSKHRAWANTSCPIKSMPALDSMPQPILLINKTSLRVSLNTLAKRVFNAGGSTSTTDYAIEELVVTRGDHDDFRTMLNNSEDQNNLDWEKKSITMEFRRLGSGTGTHKGEVAVSSFLDDGNYWYSILVRRIIPNATTLTSSMTAISDRQPLPTLRPTSLPPPSITVPRSDRQELINFARETIPDLNSTGVILADRCLGMGFVNTHAKELLMGTGGSSELAGTGMGTEDWWSRSEWSSTSDGEGWTTFSGSSGFTSAGVFQHHHEEMSNPFFPSLEKLSSTPAAKLFQLPQHRPPTTVAHILAHSLFQKKRALFDGVTSPWTDALDRSRDKKNVMGMGSDGRSSVSGSSFNGGDLMKKPYRVFDASFSRRILDPLEELMETCVVPLHRCINDSDESLQVR